jgi:hypothetical protein
MGAAARGGSEEIAARARTRARARGGAEDVGELDPGGHLREVCMYDMYKPNICVASVAVQLA